MSKRYRLSLTAEQELDEILEYVLKSSGPNNALTVSQTFCEAFELLGDQPLIGHTRNEMPDASVRFWVVYSYLVVYRTGTTPLEIVRVLHGARELTQALEDLV